MGAVLSFVDDEPSEAVPDNLQKDAYLPIASTSPAPNPSPPWSRQARSFVLGLLSDVDTRFVLAAGRAGR